LLFRRQRNSWAAKRRPVLGRQRLTDLAAANDNPVGEAVGRGMKVAKEQIVGMVAAVDWVLEQNDEANQAEYMRRADTIIRAVKDVPTIEDRDLCARKLLTTCRI